MELIGREHFFVITLSLFSWKSLETFFFFKWKPFFQAGYISDVGKGFLWCSVTLIEETLLHHAAFLCCICNIQEWIRPCSQHEASFSPSLVIIFFSTKLSPLLCSPLSNSYCWNWLENSTTYSLTFLFVFFVMVKPRPSSCRCVITEDQSVN